MITELTYDPPLKRQRYLMGLSRKLTGIPVILPISSYPAVIVHVDDTGRVVLIRRGAKIVEAQKPAE